MPTFPTLKTGAVSQYPTALALRFGPTRSVEFLDGSSQRYCTGPRVLRRWTLHLERLDAREEARVMDFLLQYQNDLFSFPDPFTGETVPRCTLLGAEFQNSVDGELDRTISAVIEELS